MTAIPSRPAPSGARVAVAGLVSLAVAMGIGRFAFTPILPMMLAEGVVDLPAASWLASANYMGYLAGALLCACGPWFGRRLPWPRPGGAWLVRAGLLATAALTLAMALPAPALWPLWRFGAGVASAFVLVYTTGWCLAILARHGRSALGGVMFAGPGAGIVASGLVASALVAANGRAGSAWLVFGLLATALSAAVWTIFAAGEGRSEGAAAPAAPLTGSALASAAAASSAQVACFALAYGLAGFGYIVTATFLPVIARAALPGSPALDLFWPVFGAGVIAGALLSTRLRIAGDLRLLLAAAYVVQALGIGLGIVVPSEAGFALGSFVLGLPFTAITFFAMQEARRLRPRSPASLIGLLSATYGIGQIVGPPMVSLLLERAASASDGFRLSLGIAAGALLAGAGLHLLMRRGWPVPERPGR